LNGDGEPVVLFKSDWALNYFLEKNPGMTLSELPFRNGVALKQRTQQ
jgi:hypothetical protein